MIKGFFSNNTPLIKIIVAWGRSIQTPVMILDTGFSGDLQVTPEIAVDLGLKVVGVTNVELADGSVKKVPVALAVTAMEGQRNYVQVLISNSMPLAGISFLSKFGYKAIVDCKYRTVVLEKA